ncbi:MAG: hypothetical protein JWP12_3271 [Bacteroidetes bacterium]|nr:hypothetical protein [Bacteroidota bacterium]
MLTESVSIFLSLKLIEIENLYQAIAILLGKFLISASLRGLFARSNLILNYILV